VELYVYSLSTPSWRGAQLKHRDNFTFTFTVYNYCVITVSLLSMSKYIIFSWGAIYIFTWFSKYQRDSELQTVPKVTFGKKRR